MIAEPADGQPGEPSPLARFRASDEDRDRVIEVLRVAAGDGRLTAEELDQRLEAAFCARTYGDLAELTGDLPAARLAAAASQDAGPDMVRISTRSGSAARTGRWVVPRQMQIGVASGAVRLDFTEAVVSRPALHIDADVGSGSLTLITRPGIVVDTGDVTVRSGSIKVRAPSSVMATTRLLITVSGRVGSGVITVRPPRRTFWQWLLRRPRPGQLPPWDSPG